MKNNFGYTLIELLLVIVILGILISSIIVIINPFAQLNKIKNAKIVSELQQLKTSLDSYYNDHNSYPLTMNFGSDFADGNTIYAKNVPQNSDSSYFYQTNPDNPHWAITYARLNDASKNTISCQLESLENCLPINYKTSGYNYCNILGTPDCEYVASSNLPIPPSSSSAAVMPTELASYILSLLNPSSSPTPTPTPSNNQTCSVDWSNFPKSVVQGSIYTFPVTFNSNFGIRWPSLYWNEGGSIILRSGYTNWNTNSYTTQIKLYANKTPGTYHIRPYLDNSSAVGVECTPQKTFTILPCNQSMPSTGLTCSIDWSKFPTSIVQGQTYSFPVTFYSNFGIRWPSLYWNEGGQTIYRNLNVINWDVNSYTAQVFLNANKAPGTYHIQPYLDDYCARGVLCSNPKTLNILAQ